MMKWLLAGTAAISMTAAAAEPENRTFHSGAFEVTAIQDAPSTMRAGLFPAIPETEFCKLAGAPLAPASVNVFLLKRDGKSILVDTGNGGERGTAIRKLRQLGIAPEMIDVILLTHMHGDHIGGLLNAAGGAAFPTAIVYVAEPERDYWLSEEAGSGGALAGKVRTAYGNRLKTFRFGEEPVPGIKALDASGHTPGHTVFDTGDLLIVGDLLHRRAATCSTRPRFSFRIRKSARLTTWIRKKPPESGGTSTIRPRHPQSRSRECICPARASDGSTGKRPGLSTRRNRDPRFRS